MPAPSTVKLLRSKDSTLIFAEATGDYSNPHVVLLAGLTLSGCAFDDFCSDQRLLDALYIVRYDIRGHARSGQPNTPEAYESKRFAEDFEAVVDAFELKRPILAGWSMGAAVATDVCAHLPPSTLSGIIYLAGVPSTGLEIAQMAAPPLMDALPGLISTDAVWAFRSSALIFTEKLFANPQDVPYALKCMYLGHSLSPEIMGLSLARQMEVENLWKAGGEGLPLLSIQGTEDQHRKGAQKDVDEMMKPHFKDYEMVWLNGRGHALYYEAPDEIVDLMIRFAKRVGGKDYYTA
ncbi:alpha/beta-hydrolase [Stereum hirsutum FP-91666 SS1]|uniref:alpha/beta-hydrolase n=1 Tax=Stereum hirsutum (strain FP-91666) TaxID=721885 RepID=UPI000440ABD4|nr:alpha/beta-hydrolase [Stereum hirsutum FP-91666 SS1]EIM90674.1 alpha/beta-hydrolase [Stereum hirsutum FP-91666 SS1]